MFGGGWEGGGAGDVQTEVVRRDGLFRGGLGLAGEGLKGGEEFGVDCWDGGKKGYLVGITAAGSVWSGESPPHNIRVKREQELNGRASQHRSQNGIDSTMDMVQREKMQQIVLGGVFPSFDERGGLGG